MTGQPKPHRQNMPACYRELIALAIVARTTGPIYGTRLSPEPGDETTFVPSKEDQVKNTRALLNTYIADRRRRGVNPNGTRLPGDDEIDAEYREAFYRSRRNAKSRRPKRSLHWDDDEA